MNYHPFAIPLPRQRDAFKPRAHAGILSKLVQEAWDAKKQAEFNDAMHAEAVATLADHFRRIYPAEDMAILQKYGCAGAATHCTVRTYDPETHHYEESFGVELPAIVAPNGRLETVACDPRLSERPDRAVTPGYQAELRAEGKWDDFCADQDSRDASLPPRSIDSYFAALRDARKAFWLEYRQCTDWPEARKTEAGQWPTWGEIAETWPVLGAHLRGLWEAAP